MTALGSPKGERNESICKKDRRSRKGLDKINKINGIQDSKLSPTRKLKTYKLKT